MAGLEGRIDGIAVQLLYPQVQELRAALAALEYVPPVPAAASTEEEQQQDAASPAAEAATADGAVLGVAGMEGLALSSSSSAAGPEAAVAVPGSVSATLADRFVMAAGAVAAAAAASAAAPVQ
jgi:hypothetical protein